MSTEPLPPSPGDLVLEIGGLRIQPGERISGFIYRRLVGKGGMANVLLTEDPAGQLVALKVLKSSRVGSGMTRFKREFRALSRLRHPNVIRVDAYGDLHGHPYIAMEYVDGTDLHQVIHSFKHLSSEERWRRCEQILVEMCRALSYIHRRGLIHRDLKPSNILIDKDGHCKLTDFGIVKDLDPDADSMVSTTLVGTWAYASPEQINGQPIDHRSDLYSLGVILFAMLTGRRPFVAKDLGGYLELHRTHQAPAARDVDPQVPAHLDEICSRLLRKHPRERYRSAQEILYKLEQSEPEAQERAGIWQPPLVGRAHEEEWLRGHVAALARAQGGVVLVEGPDGVGRTRLLEEALIHQAWLMGIPTWRERGALRDGPLGPILRLCAALKKDLGERVPAALLDAMAAFSQDGGPNLANARDRLVEAMVETAKRALEDGPAILVMDDVSLAQPPTIEAVVTLARRLVGQEARPLLIVCVLQSDRLSPRMLALQDGSSLGFVPHRLEVGPLDRAAIRRMVEQMMGIGRGSQVLGERLQRETEGNPLFLTLFLQSLIAAGTLVRQGNLWRLAADIDEIATGYLDIPPGVRQVVRSRLAPLRPPERQLVDALAIQGREVELDILLEVLDLEEEDGLERMDRLIDVGILRERQVGDALYLDFTHAKFGDVVYRELDSDRRAELHRLTAAALERRYHGSPTAVEAVGEHYRRAGESGKAYQYLVTAAARLLERGLATEAMDVANRAEGVEDAARVDMAPQEYSSIKRQLLEVRADLHFLRGEWNAARDLFTQAVSLAEKFKDPAALLRCRVRLGRVLRHAGELDNAEQLVRTTLLQAREQQDREVIVEGLYALAGIGWSRGQLDLCESSAQEALILATGPAAARSRAQLLLALTAVQASRGQFASAASGLAEAQLLLKDLRMKAARSLALANLSEVLLGQGELAVALADAREALHEARDVGHRLGEAAALRVLAAILARLGRFAEARECLNACFQITETLRMAPETLATRYALARLALKEGRLSEVRPHLDAALQSARSGDPEQYVPALEALWARLSALEGSTEEAQQHIALGSARVDGLPHFRRAQVSLDLAEAQAKLGQRAAAVAMAQSALHLAGVRGFRLIALESLALLASLSAGPEQQRLLGEAEDYLQAVTVGLSEGDVQSLRQRLQLWPLQRRLATPRIG